MIEIKYAFIDIFMRGGGGGGAGGNVCLRIQFTHERNIDFIFGTKEEAEAELERIKRDGIKVWCAPRHSRIKCKK